MIAVATLGCDRKASDGFPSWPALFELDGDYWLYFNYERTPQQLCESLYEPLHIIETANAKNGERKYSFDVWCWHSNYAGAIWRNLPRFDQDQARLASIVCARNMCIEFAMQTDASHLLFVDADIIPPKDTIPKLLQCMQDYQCDAVGGLVYGRGVHKDARYVFQEKSRDRNHGYPVIYCEHANIGFTMISRRLFEATRFRWGTSHYPDGRVSMTSDDPSFHLDSFIKFGKWMYVREDVVGQHVGDLKATDTSQF